MKKSIILLLLVVFLLFTSTAIAQETESCKVFLKDGSMLIGTLLSYSRNFVTIKTTYGVLKINEDDIKYIVIPATEELKGSYDKPCIVLKTGDIITGKVSSYTPPIERIKVSSALGELTIEKLSDILYIILEAQGAPSTSKFKVPSEEKLEVLWGGEVKLTVGPFERLKDGGVKLYIQIEDISDSSCYFEIIDACIFDNMVRRFPLSESLPGRGEEVTIDPKMPMKTIFIFKQEELKEVNSVYLSIEYRLHCLGWEYPAYYTRYIGPINLGQFGEISSKEIPLKEKLEVLWGGKVKLTVVSFERLKDGGIKFYIQIEDISESSGDFKIRNAYILDDMGRKFPLSNSLPGKGEKVTIEPKMPMKGIFIFKQEELKEANSIYLSISYDWGRNSLTHNIGPINLLP